jgi:hypothetical protein
MYMIYKTLCIHSQSTSIDLDNRVVHLTSWRTDIKYIDIILQTICKIRVCLNKVKSIIGAIEMTFIGFCQLEGIIDMKLKQIKPITI